MADLMEERIHSIERTAGFGFVLASTVLSLSLLLHPTFADVNQTAMVLQSIARARGESWMQLHAIMALGFVIATAAFCGLAFLLHMKGSSGSASIVTACALLGGGLWVSFLCAELYAYRFFSNVYSIDPGGATMLFSTIWFWKLGAVLAGGALFFIAVIFSGIAGVKREVLPLWLGWGGALFAGVGLLIYTVEFWGSTATGAASQPMQWPAMRYGVGLPLQIWMMGVGILLLQRYFSRPMRAYVAPPRPAGETARRRPPEAGERPVPHEPPAAATAPGAGAGSGAASVGAGMPAPGGPSGAPPSGPAPTRVPHPALAPREPEPPPPPSEEKPKGPKPPQIYPG